MLQFMQIFSVDGPDSLKSPIFIDWAFLLKKGRYDVLRAVISFNKIAKYELVE